MNILFRGCAAFTLTVVLRNVRSGCKGPRPLSGLAPTTPAEDIKSELAPFGATIVDKKAGMTEAGTLFRTAEGVARGCGEVRLLACSTSARSLPTSSVRLRGIMPWPARGA